MLSKNSEVILLFIHSNLEHIMDELNKEDKKWQVENTSLQQLITRILKYDANWSDLVCYSKFATQKPSSPTKMTIEIFSNLFHNNTSKDEVFINYCLQNILQCF